MQVRTNPTPTTSAADVVDLRDYLHILRNRWWLVVGVTVVCVALALTFSVTRTPKFTARTSVLVQPTVTGAQSLRPDQLISLETEVRIAKSASVANLARDELDVNSSATDLLEHVDVDATAETLVLDILYTDTERTRAAAGANAFAAGYLRFKREQALATLLDTRSVIEDQIADVRDRIREQTEILRTATPGTQEYEQAQALLDVLNGETGVLIAQLAYMPATVNPGQVILPATPPESPSSPKHVLNLAIGLLLGIFLGVIAAFVRERTDDRIRTRGDLELGLSAPVLAVIPRVHGWGRGGAEVLVSEQQPRSPGAEAYRMLRTNVLSLADRSGLTTIAVVSPLAQEGKSATTANLATVLAQADKRVLAISADLRRPRLHQFFGGPNARGLADILRGEADLADVLQESRIPSLFHISSGDTTPNPTELLQSARMRELIARAGEEFEFVIIDCAPVIGLADALAVTSVVDGVLFVASFESTRWGAVLQAREHLQHVGSSIIGGVLNNVPHSKTGAYQYGYGGYGGYGASPYPDAVDGQGGWRAPDARATRRRRLGPPRRSGSRSG